MAVGALTVVLEPSYALWGCVWSTRGEDLTRERDLTTTHIFPILLPIPKSPKYLVP